MTPTDQPAATHLKGTFGIPGTFEVHDRNGRVYGTYTSAYFKLAEADAARRHAKAPERGFTWTRIPDAESHADTDTQGEATR
jgi:hypothetical protein